MKQDLDFGTAKMLPLIVRMSLPTIAAQFVNLLYGIVDRIFIGHIPEAGTQALAGVGVCNSIILIVAAFAQFTGGGASPLTAIELGKGDRKQAEKILGNGITLLLIFGAILMIAVYAFMDPMLRRIGASDVTLPYAHSYLAWYMTGTIFVMITIGLNPFLTTEGHPKAAMVSVLIGACINIALDPLFIFTFGMGVKGAAIATVLSQGVSSLWILKVLLSPGAMLAVNRKTMKPDGAVIRRILALGVSPFVMGSTESLIGFVMNSGLAAFGDIYVSTLTIMQSCMTIISTPLQGFTAGVSPVISYNYGRGNIGRIKEGKRIVFTVMTSFNFIITLLIILFPAAFARIFTSDAQLIAQVQKYAVVFLGGFLIFGLQRSCQCMFLSMNQPKISLFIALLRKVFLLVPLALILPKIFGVTGIYLAESVADATAATCCFLIFLRRFPKILDGVRKNT
ncbi:MAG: MATE family efflux transporter [Lachnospiraceae bacterium]|nr:MATE family efflux transporter [Lachnospiraceae bacterium]MCH4030148.1 MATE family efflux transporter [Lachnospiraceae bacterium]MCH4070198.1 MATE family efflux transporter [Lachnospiraceae bacterium]MCH4107704.1 MATE family efflux transporter [Lachnospiraceae bacterium]MCI1301445.1 MATE family efflux transporter [Lachnospiraceae bacterium]